MRFPTEIEPELRAIAARRLRDERDCSLEPDDLVNEIMIRLIKQDVGFEDRARLLGFSARIARQTLVDHARQKHASKRHHDRVTLVTAIPDHEDTDLLELDAALLALAEIDIERAALVEMRFFGGMTMEEIAAAQSISLSTAKRRWGAARLWLETQLSGA
ncbi:MAG: sigma-70 family RNA polymerase sigma factor [Pseudomonadota bacterium]